MRQKKYKASNGTEYTLQHPGARWYLRLQKGNDVEKMTDAIFEHVIVMPKVKVEDFDDDIPLMEELAEQGLLFLREKGDKSQAGSQG